MRNPWVILILSILFVLAWVGMRQWDEKMWKACIKGTPTFDQPNVNWP